MKYEQLVFTINKSNEPNILFSFQNKTEDSFSPRIVREPYKNLIIKDSNIYKLGNLPRFAQL